MCIEHKTSEFRYRDQLQKSLKYANKYATFFEICVN